MLPTGEITNAIDHAIKYSKNIENAGVRVREFSGGTVEGSLEAADMLHYNFNYLLGRNHFLGTFFVLLLAIGMIFLGEGDVQSALCMFGIALFIVLWFSFLLCMTFRSYGNSRVTYGFSDSGICLKDSRGFLLIPWKKLLVKKSRRYYFFYYSWCGALVLPRRWLNDLSEEWIGEFIRNFQLTRRRIFRSGNLR